tara:strand:- start:544 stop:723 length:180 start_codon:yes stop_codon:yes gene_type:complete
LELTACHGRIKAVGAAAAVPGAKVLEDPNRQTLKTCYARDRIDFEAYSPVEGEADAAWR